MVAFLYTTVNWVIYFLEIHVLHIPMTFIHEAEKVYSLRLQTTAIKWVWEPQRCLKPQACWVNSCPEYSWCCKMCWVYPAVTWCGWFFPQFVMKSWIINFQISREFKHPSIILYSGNIYRIPNSRFNCILELKRVQDY